ncbi:translationally-controlled tumor protein homolog [Dermacentor andersoni]|uniref:translationally-controlled tumor protein homolog n=1 Tax=Dermacentor andersoni TaxID=34620 RepID=UPI00241695B0|nr:translationally-controlled tumor protein homolog [Dermacentor andersoni]
MLIFKDISGDKMFTDSSKYKLMDDCTFEIECHHGTHKQGEMQLDGANRSAEEVYEGTDENAESSLGLVLNMRLTETCFTKADYNNYLKTYTKVLQEMWQEEGKWPEEIEDTKSKLTTVVKKLCFLSKLGDYQFIGDPCNAQGIVGPLEYREQDSGGETAVMMIFKHRLDEEKDVNVSRAEIEDLVCSEEWPISGSRGVDNFVLGSPWP